MDDPHGTGDRLVRFEHAAIALAEAIDDLVRDIDTAVLNLPDATKRTHERRQANRARTLARLLRAAVAEARQETQGNGTT